MEFRHEVHGEYIKMNQIEQSDDGKTFCFCYQDNGRFLALFMNQTGKVLRQLNVSEHLVIDDLSKPITGFWEPLITAAFIDNDRVLVAVYHRIQKKQYHFTYSVSKGKSLSQTTVLEIKNCTELNFPIKCFYSSEYNECYVFYRQGHGFTIDPENPAQCGCEQITDQDLGAMYLLFDRALITRSSNSILFFMKN